jgi:hypothetical protein
MIDRFRCFETRLRGRVGVQEGGNVDDGKSGHSEKQVWDLSIGSEVSDTNPRSDFFFTDSVIF